MVIRSPRWSPSISRPVRRLFFSMRPLPNSTLLSMAQLWVKSDFTSFWCFCAGKFGGSSLLTWRLWWWIPQDVLTTKDSSEQVKLKHCWIVFGKNLSDDCIIFELKDLTVWCWYISMTLSDFGYSHDRGHRRWNWSALLHATAIHGAEQETVPASTRGPRRVHECGSVFSGRWAENCGQSAPGRSLHYILYQLWPFNTQARCDPLKQICDLIQ